MPPEKRALLIVHAWMEEGSSRPLRAHLRATSDVEGDFDSDLILSNIDAVCDGVRSWLERVVGTPTGPSDGSEASDS